MWRGRAASRPFFFSLPKHHAITCHHAPASQQPAGCCQTRPGRVVHKLCRPPDLVTKGGGCAHNKIFLDRLAWSLSDVASRARHLQLESRTPDLYYRSIPHGSIYGLFPISRCLQLKSLQGRLYASLVTIRLRLPGASFTKCVSTAWSLHLTTPPGCAIHKMLDRLAWLLSDSASGRVFYDLVSTAWSFLSDDTSRVPRLQITFSSKEGG